MTTVKPPKEEEGESFRKNPGAHLDGAGEWETGQEAPAEPQEHNRVSHQGTVRQPRPLLTKGHHCQRQEGPPMKPPETRSQEARPASGPAPSPPPTPGSSIQGRTEVSPAPESGG